ncbi:MAG: hypothetical protein KatS3mg096_814 [Candidatus Parcubacteria bacterium]|nr:MAG: hypothetical protein KatS3mg096_814 [Candidatus Parcubacteria bacterium]
MPINIFKTLVNALANRISSSSSSRGGSSIPTKTSTPAVASTPAVSRQPGVGSLVSPGILGLATVGETMAQTLPAIGKEIASKALPAAGKILSSAGRVLSGPVGVVSSLLIPTRLGKTEIEKYTPASFREETSGAFLSPSSVSTATSTKTTPITELRKPEAPPPPVSPAKSMASQVSTGMTPSITPPPPSQPTSFVSQPGAVNLPSPTPTAPPSPTLSLGGGGGGAPAPVQPTTSNVITPTLLSDIIRVLMRRETPQGLVGVPEGLPFSYILKPRRLLGEELVER